MNRIEDKVLYSTKADSTENIVEQRYIHFLLDMIRKELNTTGDRVWLYDAQKQKSVMVIFYFDTKNLFYKAKFFCIFFII